MTAASIRRPRALLRLLEVAVLLLLAGCATTHAGTVLRPDDVAALRMNQSPEEVIAILGEPGPEGRGVGWGLERSGQEALDYPAERCTFLIYVSFEMGVGMGAGPTPLLTATTAETTISDMQILVVEFFDGRAFSVTLNGEPLPTASPGS
jgi:hypothetical protein